MHNKNGSAYESSISRATTRSIDGRSLRAGDVMSKILRRASLLALVAMTAHSLGCSTGNEASVVRSAALTASLHGVFEAREGAEDSCPWAPDGTSPLPDAHGNLIRSEDGNGFATARVEKTLTFDVPAGARIKNLRLRNPSFNYDDVLLITYGQQIIVASDNRLVRYASGGGPMAASGATVADVLAPIRAGVPDLADVKPFPAAEAVVNPTYDWTRILGQSVRNEELKPGWCAPPNASCAIPVTEQDGALDINFADFKTLDELAYPNADVTRRTLSLVVVGDNDTQSDCRYKEIVVDAEYDLPPSSCQVSMPVQRLVFEDGQHFYTTDGGEVASLVSNTRARLEEADAWRFSDTDQAGAVPFYRCYDSKGHHLYTADPSCEAFGSAANESRIGYVFSSQATGTVPLYRLWNPVTGDHFYTIDLTEAKHASATLGYSEEGVAGFVYRDASCQLPPPPVEIACNGKDDNLDGQIDEGSCCPTPAVHRLVDAKGEHFYTTDPAEAGSAVSGGGYTSEQPDAWRLARTNQPGTVPFFRCNNKGLHLYTADAQCEYFGPTTNEGLFGYIFSSAAAGTVPLYRSFNPTTGDHFYTTTETEAKNAQANIGYISEGIAGYVFSDESCKSPPPPPPPVEIPCNGKDDDFNGEIDEGSCCPTPGVERLLFNNGPHFYTTDSSEVAGVIAGGDASLESADAWRFAKTSQPGTVPFYRCGVDRFHLYTTDVNCEFYGAGTLESRIGYIFPAQQPGTVPLYRVYASSGDHLYTIDASEAARAIDFGYVSEGISGYVFRNATCQ